MSIAFYKKGIEINIFVKTRCSIYENENYRRNIETFDDARYTYVV